MGPKEKAKELLEKFMEYVDHNSYTYLNSTQNAKQCSIIAIDEIIKNNAEFLDGLRYHEELNYWEEVKQEIEKL
jgi:hypothetical protein